MTREEAIQIIRKNIPHLGIGANEMTEALNELFPELRESEDERIRRDLIHDIQMLPNLGILTLHSVSEYVAYLEKQEQKPSWSEEDEKMRSRILDIFACDQKHYLDETAWLKSLRPGWKPTEEQMDALAYAIQILDYGLSPKAAKAGEELEHLREQLKKL